MFYGVCAKNPEIAAAAAESGFDFLETSVAALLRPSEDEAAFEIALDQMRQAELPCPAVNGFIPGNLKIVGPDASLEPLKTFAATAFQRAEKAGVEIIVFGSGSARRIPDDFDPQVAHAQLVAFCSMLGPIAADHGVTVVVEPLNQAECNVLTTCAESAELVREVDHPAVRLLIDAYHLLKDGDSCADVAEHASLLRHAHIATIPGRRPPGVEPCDFGPFFDALAKGGYEGRISIEAKIEDARKELPVALAAMKAFAESP